MPGNIHPDPPAGTLVISALVVLNAIVLQEGLTTDSSVYQWFFITVPLLVIAIFSSTLRGHAILRKSGPGEESGHLN